VNYKKEEATTFETARFKEDYPKLYEQFTKISNRRKWIVEKK
jgi:predicted phage-related endonuclease